MKRIVFPLKLYTLVAIFIVYAIFRIHGAIVNLSADTAVTKKAKSEERYATNSLQANEYKKGSLQYNVYGKK